MKQTVRRYVYGVADSGGRQRGPMRQRGRELRRNVLDQRAAERHVDCLHASADAEHRQTLRGSHAGDIQFECIAPLADHTKIISLSLAIKVRWEIGAASSQE